MFCPNCGNKLPDGAKFCARCGTKAAAPSAADHTGQPEAPQQGPASGNTGRPEAPQQGPAGANTGWPAAGPQPFAPQPPVQEKKRSRLPLILGLTAGLAALVLVFIFVLLPLMRGDGEEGGTQAAGEPSGTPESSSVQPGESDEPERNSNYYSLWGAVTHYRGYTYFVAAGQDNDCSVNGESASESIWRISDDADAQPERLYTIPSRIAVGTVQNTIFFMTGFGGRIWFYEMGSTEQTFRWISPDGSEQGTVPAPQGFSQTGLRVAYYDEGRYFCTLAEQSPDGGWIGKRLVLDLASETWQEPDLSFIPGGRESEEMSGVYINDRGRLAYVLCYGRGYVYFLQGSYKEDDEPVLDQGLYRARYGSGEVEEVGAMKVGDGEGLDLSFTYAADQAFYFVPDDDIDGAYEEGTLYAILFADGSTKKILGPEDGFEMRYTATLCISDTEIWYVSDDGLHRCDPDGGNQQVAADPAGESKYAPAICGDWIFYSLNDHPEYARIAKTGRIFPGGPLVEGDRVTPDEQQDGDWKYREFPAYAEITGYTGSETVVTVPETIGGKPVRAVGSWYGDGFGNVKTLRLPESVAAVNYLYIDGLERIELPAGLQLFNHRSFVYTFRTDGELTVVYPGTKAQWDALCAYSEKLNDMEGIDAGYGETTYRLICSDAEETLVPVQE